MCETGLKVNLVVVNPKDPQHLGCGGVGQDQVNSRQHTEKEVHGFMESPVYLDDEKKSEVSNNRCHINYGEDEGNVKVRALKTRDA